MTFLRRIGAPVAVTLVACTAAVLVSAVMLGFSVGGSSVAGFFEVWVLDGVALASALVCCWFARPGTERLPWFLVGLAFLSWSLGNFYWAIRAVTGVELPVPSLADIGWLGFYPFAYAALVLLVRQRVRAGHARWLDGVVASLSAAAVMWVMVLDPVVSAIDRKPSAAIGIYLFYGIGDLVLFGLALGALVVTGNRGRCTWVLLSASFGLFTLADGFYLVRSAQETFEPGTLVSVGWPAAALLAAIAASLPREHSEPEEQHAGWRRVIVPSACGVVSICVLLYGTVANPTIIGPALAAAAILAVIARLILVFRQHHQMLEASRGEALRDPLTGLGNRRSLRLDFERMRAEGTPVVFAVYDLDGFKEHNDTHGHHSGDAVLVKVAATLADAIDGYGGAYRFGGDEFCVLVDANQRDLVEVLPLALTDAPLSAACGTCEVPFEAVDLDTATSIADERMYARKPGGRSTAGQQVAELSARLIDERLPDLAGHSRRVAELAETTGRQLGLGPADLSDLRLAATLHDIGKLALPDQLLHKTGPLDPAEWQVMRSQTVIGERLLLTTPALAKVARLVRSSHERVDGTGYPDQLRGNQIPLLAQIIAVCDAYDTMTAGRTDRPLASRRDALAALTHGAGTQFEQTVVDAFLAATSTLDEPATELSSKPAS